jgi:hypothetical protein
MLQLVSMRNFTGVFMTAAASGLIISPDISFGSWLIALF